MIRDRVLRFKAGGAETLGTRKAPAKTPILTDEHRTALTATVEAGPKPDMDGIGRWRRVDPAQGGGAGGTGRPGQSSDAGTGPSAMGVAMGGRQALRPPAARRTARRGHRGVQQNVCDVVDHIRSQWGGKPIELRVQDDARMGQKNKRTRRRARRGTRPRAPHDQRTEGACLFGAIRPARAKGDGQAMPGATLTPWLSLSSSSVNRSMPGHTPSRSLIGREGRPHPNGLSPTTSPSSHGRQGHQR